MSTQRARAWDHDDFVVNEARARGQGVRDVVVVVVVIAGQLTVVSVRLFERL